jgi:hypothetical protein
MPVTVLAPDPAASPGRWFADLVALIILAAAVTGLAWLIVAQPQRGWLGAPHVPVTLDGEHYRVDTRQLEWLRRFSALHFSEGEQAARALAAAEIDARLDAAFGGVSARLPEFADWYYSLAGEYGRLSMLALSWVNLADEDFVARRATALLFPEGTWDADLDALDRHTRQQLSAHHEQVRTGWLAELTTRLSQQRVPAPLPSDVAQDSESLGLDALANQILARERAALTTRASIASVAATGAAVGPVVWRAASRRVAASGARPALGRAAGRGAARAGSAAAGGATLCAPGGPVALGCAVVAGAVAWVATDWALLRVDEAMHRDQLLAALDESLTMLRNDVQRDLLAAYDGLIARHYDIVQQDIRATFVPVSAR